MPISGKPEIGPLHPVSGKEKGDAGESHNPTKQRGGRALAVPSLPYRLLAPAPYPDANYWQSRTVVLVRNEHARLSPREEHEAMRLGEIEVHDYARQLLEAHGAHAVAEAAQKACAFEQQGEREQAEIWRHIEAALKLMQGPHQS